MEWTYSMINLWLVISFLSEPPHGVWWRPSFYFGKYHGEQVAGNILWPSAESGTYQNRHWHSHCLLWNGHGYMNITLSTGLYYLSNLFYYDIVFFFKHTVLFNCCCMIMYKFIFFIQAYDWSIVVTWPCYKLCYKPYYTKNRKFIKHTILKIEFHNKKSLFFERLEPAWT